EVLADGGGRGGGGETVTAAPRRARPYVNAVLRALARLGPPWPWPEGDDTAALGVRLSYPDWIVNELVTTYGWADAHATLAIGNEPPAVAIRGDTRRADRAQIAGEWGGAGGEGAA